MYRSNPRLRKVILAIAIPVMAFLALAAWSLSSPVAASPDDDFHLPAIWCGLGERAGLCENPDDEPVERLVPTPLSDPICFAFRSADSAACWDEDAPGMSSVDRANADGLYPPVFYATMSIFASPNVSASVMAMRLFNSAFAVGLLTAVFFALPRWIRPALVISVVATAVPLGLFLLSSTNPSSWAILSAATIWVCLFGATQTVGRRRIVLSALAVFGAVIGAGARADAAIYAVFAVGIAGVLGLRFRKDQLIPILGAIVTLAVSIGFYVGSWQGSALVTGLTVGNRPLTLAEHAENLLAIPTFWTGALGGWPLGWLDTPMPATVSVLSTAVFFGAIFVGLRNVNLRRAIATALTLIALVIVPFALVAQSRVMVGNVVQPRYFLPLMVIAVGVASLRLDAEHSWKGMRFALGGIALIGSMSVALHTNIERYTTGLDVRSIDPGALAEWWWSYAPSPSVTWIAGTIAFALMFVGFWLVLPSAKVTSRESETRLPDPATPL